jgi:lysyl-tRNA synthetase class 2
MPTREEELFQERVTKLERLRARGIDPYPARYDRTHTSTEALRAFEVWEGSAKDGSTRLLRLSLRSMARNEAAKRRPS